MQIHQIVNHPALQIVLYPIDDDLAPNINDLAVGHIRLVLIQSLVYPLVHSYPLSEVLCRLLGILPLVVGACCLYFENVAHDHIFLVALALHEQRFDTLGIAALLDPTSSVFG